MSFCGANAPRFTGEERKGEFKRKGAVVSSINAKQLS